MGIDILNHLELAVHHIQDIPAMENRPVKTRVL